MAINFRSRNFCTEILGLYTGPQVTIRLIKPPGSVLPTFSTTSTTSTPEIDTSHRDTSPKIITEFLVSKEIVCKQSPYFSAMLRENAFLEGSTGVIIFEEEEGIVTEKSLELVVQWLYTGQIPVYNLKGDVALLLAFTRLADMISLTGIEPRVCLGLKMISRLELHIPGKYLPKSTHDVIFSTSDLDSIALLPKGHAVRRKVIEASVEGYFMAHDNMYRNYLLKHPVLKSEFANLVEAACESMELEASILKFKEPFWGKKCQIRTYQEGNDNLDLLF